MTPQSEMRGIILVDLDQLTGILQSEALKNGKLIGLRKVSVELKVLAEKLV